MVLTAREMLAIQVSERTMSVLSILGSLFIISTFLRWHYFRKPINRLVFYASFGNMLSNIATLISISALPNQSAPYEALCEFQGILIQWFMMADTLWVFSMALNVMLVFFRGYDSAQLLRLEKWYILFSYGSPGSIAIAYLIMNHHGPNKKKVIGPATIWCWVGKDLEWMRIAFFYAPIWVVIGATMCIYIATGRQIFKKRAELRSFTKIPDGDLGNTITTTDFRNIKVETEMKVETSYKHVSIDQDSLSRASFSSTKELSVPADVSTLPPSSGPFDLMKGTTRREDSPRTGYNATAFATIQVPDRKVKNSQSFSSSQRNTHKRRTTALEGNAAAWSYFKVAFLMFAALFIVWVPSTVNRLQQFIDKEHSIFGLNLASALVLPLQGFWNSMIYISTTWPECKRALADTLDALSSRRTARNKRPYAKNNFTTSTTNEVQHFEAPIPMKAVKARAESQRGLQSMSSAESVRAGAARSEP
ncbi:uncharacterized protein N0V89_001902 [Didymosphaeria variabile]|uniref:G-protein coupled receptors family 2 profile 2 domain-containing protein n=1 Tax=Didymosphaeria variabile TaxID=1932322 RepID=A0A9W8XQP5_9PLEO|nr:uncharacterized protein N0V89_001902 [Didymosphaeria variabile]KAJ4357327.1 hypothetical protein N0V89_001902 [Didymosphaeria variabile]